MLLLMLQALGEIFSSLLESAVQFHSEIVLLATESLLDNSELSPDVVSIFAESTSSQPLTSLVAIPMECTLFRSKSLDICDSDELVCRLYNWFDVSSWISVSPPPKKKKI